MRTRLIIFSLISVCLTAGCSDDMAQQHGNPETITVDGAGYVKSVFEEGAAVIYDSECTIVDIHPYFAGFEMLISVSDAHNSGLITTDMDCIVYILALNSTTPPGWRKVSDSSHQNSVMRYVNGDSETELAIYCKRAFAGTPIEIPVLGSTFSAVPLAREIILKSGSDE